MATRNTPTTSTLEEWRVEFNELATDIGNVTGSSQGDQLTTSATDIVGAINELETNFNAFVATSEVAADNISTGDGAVNLTTSSGNITIDAAANNTDIIFKGTDATADITMLTLDGSEAGAATFNSAITGGGLLTTGGNIVIPDAGNIGSASDTDAIAIGSDGDVTLTQDLELQHDGAILSFGANDEVTLTHVHDTGILLNSTNVIQFNDASQNIGAPSATVLDINATDEIELNATLVDLNGNLDVSGSFTLAGTALTTTAAEINLIDGGTSRGTTALADADGLLINDDGTMRMTTAATVKTYMQTGLTSNSILDADSDTKIQVEEGTDEDIIRYDVAGAEVATQTARGFEFTAVGGFVMNQTTNSQTFTIASTENAIVGGPIALSGTITVEGSLAVV